MNGESTVDHEFRFVLATLRELIDSMPADRIEEQVELQVEIDGILQNHSKEEALKLLKDKVSFLEKKFKQT